MVKKTDLVKVVLLALAEQTEDVQHNRLLIRQYRLRCGSIFSDF